MNFGIELGPAFWEDCHCKGWSKSWCTNAIIIFSSIRERIDFWWCIDMMFPTLRMRKFMRPVQYCTVLDFCWGGHEMLVNSKLHIDRRRRRSIWIVYFSITLHVHWNKSQQLLYSINVRKDCRLEVITPNFGLSLTWSQTPEDMFSRDDAHLSIWFDICSIIIQLKVDRKHTLIPFLY